MDDLSDQLKDVHLNLGKDQKEQFEDARADDLYQKEDPLLGASANIKTGQTNPHENTGAIPKTRFQGTPDLNKTRGQSPVPNLHNLRHQGPQVNPRPNVNLPPPGYNAPGGGQNNPGVNPPGGDNNPPGGGNNPPGGNNNPPGGGNGPNGPYRRPEDDPQEVIRLLREQVRREAERAARAEFEAAQKMRNIQGMETKIEAMQNEWNRREGRLVQELDLLREKAKPKIDTVVTQGFGTDGLHERMNQYENDLRVMVDTLKYMSGVVRPSPHDEPEKLEQMENIDTLVKYQSKLGEERQKVIETANNFAQKYTITLKMPTVSAKSDATHDHMLRAKEVKEAIPAFNPEVAGSDLENTWECMLLHVNGIDVTESQWIRLLNYVLQGPAHKVLRSLIESGADLEEIVDTLSELYTDRKTLEDAKLEIDQFARQPNETIHAALKRLGLQLDKIRPLYPAEAWPHHKESMMEMALKTVILPEVRQELEVKMAKQHKKGFAVPFKKKLEFVSEYEDTRKKKPTARMSPAFGLATGNPVMTAMPVNAIAPPSSKGAVRKRSVSFDRGSRARSLSSSGRELSKSRHPLLKQSALDHLVQKSSSQPMEVDTQVSYHPQTYTSEKSATAPKRAPTPYGTQQKSQQFFHGDSRRTRSPSVSKSQERSNSR
ncbi:hypothetical protein M569_17281, partial [Genlisea aurea]